MPSTPHRSSRWRRRFFIAGGALLLSNVVLLVLLARAHIKPREVLDASNRDAQLLASLLAGKLTRAELKAHFDQTQRPISVTADTKVLQVGGVTFRFDQSGRLQSAEHWSKPQKD